TKRPLAVRPALGVHLQQPEIDPQLDFLFPILPFEFPDDDLARLVRPMFEDRRDIKIHEANMTAKCWQVNARLSYRHFSAKTISCRSLTWLFTPVNFRKKCA